jgi:peptide-methionine (S)-S-oxide reductase
MADQEIVTLGGGCFWCLEAVYRETEGVESAVSGYMGGHVSKPSYKDVCSERTGHVEVVQVTFHPDVISFRDILEIFFAIHDPTTLNRQGNDVGTQYRSVIFYYSDEQKSTAEAMIAELAAEKVFKDPIVTALEPAAPAGTASAFWPAEDYHQDYFTNNSYQPYCMFVVAPKLDKFRRKFAERRKAS